MLFRAIDTTSNEDLGAAFRHAADQVSALGHRFGFVVRGYDDPSLPHFTALPVALQRQVVRALRGYHASLLAAIQADKNLDQPHVSVWWAFSALGLVPSADLFRHFRPGTMVEVLNLSGSQIWRNFDFFRFNTYTLEEIHCLRFDHLYDRGSEEIEAHLQFMFERLVNGEVDMVFPDKPFYTLKEKCSRDRCVLRVQHYLCSSLRNREGEIEAVVVCTEGKVMGYGAKEVPPAGSEAPGPLRRHLSIVPPSLD